MMITAAMMMTAMTMIVCDHQYNDDDDCDDNDNDNDIQVSFAFISRRPMIRYLFRISS